MPPNSASQKFLGSTQIFFVLAALAVFVGHRLPNGLPLGPLVPDNPVVVPEHLTDAERDFWEQASSLKPADRTLLGEFYGALARAVVADGELSEPTLVDTQAFRRGHRAGLLVVWRGIGDNQPTTGLSAAIERMLDVGVGKEEVLMNPSLRSEIASTLSRMAELCATAN